MQVFVGVKSGYTFVIPLKNKGYAHTALQDFIRQIGAPLFIPVDVAREENVGEWLSVCRTYCIPQCTSEPTYQHQNRVERRIQDIKRRTTVLMSMHSTPSKYWDYAVEYAVELINHTAVRKLGWRTPFERIFGETPDISVFRFAFYEPIYFLDPSTQFPKPNMMPGRFLGIARTTGDAFTFVIITDAGIRSVILHHSVIRKRNPKVIDPYVDYENEEEGCQSKDYTSSNNIGATIGGITALVSSDTEQGEATVESIPRNTCNQGEHSEIVTYMEQEDDDLQQKKPRVI